MADYNELDLICGIYDEELTRRFDESIRIDNEIKVHWRKYAKVINY